jgi:hypothetical protein
VTFFDWWSNNSQKFLGTVTAFFSVLGGLLASGAFSMLLTPNEIGWLGIATALVTGVSGAVTVQRGVANTSMERVAKSEAVTAMAQVATAQQMAAAVNTVPGDQVPVVMTPPIQPPIGGKP